MDGLRRVARALTGGHAVDRTIERVLAEVRTRAERWLPEVTVSVSRAEIGTYRRLSTVMPLVVARLQQAGHSVLSANAPGGDWSSVISLRVRPGPPDE